MIAFTRAMTLKEFEVGNRLTNLHGTAKLRHQYWRNIRVLPWVGIAGLVFLLWNVVHIWSLRGDHGIEFGWTCGLAAYCGCIAYTPFRFKKRIGNLYDQQELHRESLTEVSIDGIHSKIPGIAESHLEWAYFDVFVETKESFFVLKKLRPMFVLIPKHVLDQKQEEELRQLLASRLAQE